MQTFTGILSQRRLSREACEALQINVALLFSQAREHCHLEAGPRRGALAEASLPPKAAEPIVLGGHCVTCTAGSGFT